jgi:hypothetical protein
MFRYAHFPFLRNKSNMRTSLNTVFSKGAGIAQSVLRQATGWTAGVGVRTISVLHSVQIGSGADPASYPKGTGVLFPGSGA